MEFNLSNKYFYRISSFKNPSSSNDNKKLYVSYISFNIFSEDVRKDILENYYDELIDKLKIVVLNFGFRHLVLKKVKR